MAGRFSRIVAGLLIFSVCAQSAVIYGAQRGWRGGGGGGGIRAYRPNVVRGGGWTPRGPTRPNGIGIAAPIIGAVGGVAGAAIRGTRGGPQYQPQYNNYPTYTQPVYNQPTYADSAPAAAAPTDAVPTATVQANPLPPPQQPQSQPAVLVVANSSPASSLQPLTEFQRDLTAQQVAAQETSDFNGMQAYINMNPTIAKDPGVISAMQALGTKVASGQIITTADADKVNAAITAVQGKLPASAAQITENAALNIGIAQGQLESLSQLQQVLKAPNPNGGSGSSGSGSNGSGSSGSGSSGSGGNNNNPAGLAANIVNNVISLVFNPNLASGQAYSVSDNCVMGGTGGSGAMFTCDGTVAQAMGLPIGSGSPAPDDGPDSDDPTTGDVVLLEPPALGTPFSYLINDSAVTIQPGQSQTLPAGSNWVIRFDRGNSLGEATYTLAAGSYEFVNNGPQGWDLTGKTFSATIDNSGSKTDFAFVSDNQNYSVPAGQSQTINSAYPIDVQFDRGGGNNKADKALDDGQTYKIAVNSSDSLWDLYSSNQVVMAGPPAPPRFLANFGNAK